MRYRKLKIAMAVILVAAFTGNCVEETVGPEANGSAALKIWLNMTGDRPDPDGCAVSVDGGPAEPIPAGETLTFTDLAQGSHVVSLASVESYCTLSGANPRTVTLAAGQTAETRFDVLCGSAVPDIGLPGMDVLGSGYDVFGNYADVAYVMAHVLDLGELDRDGLLEQVQYERATFSVISGNSMSEYATSFGLQVNVEGSYGGFHGAAGVNFSYDRRSQREYSYATVQSNIKKHGVRVALHITAEKLRAYLTESARDAINGATTEPEVDQLFDTYGTYVMRGLIVGGRLDFSTSANMAFDSKDIGIAAYAQASYSSFFGPSVSMDVETEYDLSMEEYSASEEKHLEVYGGQSEYGQNIINENDYRSWIESLDARPVFMDFERGGMIGIWELADDPSQRDFLRDQFLERAADSASEWFKDAEDASYIVSNFEEGNEGWTVRGSGLQYVPANHAIQNGFFGGYVYYDDPAAGIMYFFAPVDYMGPKDQFYEGALSYYLWLTTSCDDIVCGSPIVARDIELLSPNGNVYFEFHSRTLTSIWWRGALSGSDYIDYQMKPYRIEIPLKPGEQTHGRWKKYDGTPADTSDIRKALANVRGLQMRGEYLSDIGERANLDRVELRRAADLPNKPAGYRYISFEEEGSTEGWTAVDNANEPVKWKDAGECAGGTGGCISLNDEDEYPMYFALPVGCAGAHCLPSDLSSYYGAQLTWHMRTSGGTHWTISAPNVIIEAGNGTQLTMSFPDDCQKTFLSWQMLSVSLDTKNFQGGCGTHMNANWQVTNEPVSDEDFRSVLSDVAKILIRAEFRTYDDTAYLDEVVLLPNPQPALLSAR